MLRALLPAAKTRVAKLQHSPWHKTCTGLPLEKAAVMPLPDFSRLSLQPAATGVNLVGHAQCDPNKSAWPCMRLKPSGHNWRLAAPLLDPGITMDSCTMMVKATEGASWVRDTPYYTVKNSWQWQVFLELVREKMPRYKVRFRLAVGSESWLQAGRKPEAIPDKDPNATWYNLAKDKGFFDGDLHGSSHKDGKYIMGFVSFKEVHPVVLATLFTAMHEYNQRFPAPVLESPRARQLRSEEKVRQEEEARQAEEAKQKRDQEAKARLEAVAQEVKQAQKEEAARRAQDRKARAAAQQKEARATWNAAAQLNRLTTPQQPRSPSPPLEVEAERLLTSDEVLELFDGPGSVPDPMPEPARAPEPERLELPTDEEVRAFEREYFSW